MTQPDLFTGDTALILPKVSRIDGEAGYGSSTLAADASSHRPEDGFPHAAYQRAGITRHWYQDVALDTLTRRLVAGESLDELLVLPTGCGKTLVASTFVKWLLDCGYKILFLINRDVLIKQMEDELAENGIFPIREQADRHAAALFPSYGSAVVASVQTLRGKRLREWDPKSFDFIVSDECHGCISTLWQNARNYFKTARHLGLTATPYRTDGKSLRKMFPNEPIEPITLREAIEQGFLCPFSILQIPTDIDLRNVAMVGKDYDQRALDKIIWENTSVIATHISQTITMADGRVLPTAVFTPHVPSAEALAAALCDMGHRFAPISYKSKDPDDLHARFRSQDLQGLTNARILVEGWNAPWLECIILACPSPQIGPLKQKVGRLTRRSPQTGKTRGLVVEFLCKTSGRGLASSLDILLGDRKMKEGERRDKGVDAQIKRRAEELVRTRRDLSALEAATQAEKEIAEKIRADAKRKAARDRAKAKRLERKVRTRLIDPFSGQLSPLTPSYSNVDVKSADRATADQIKQVSEMSKGYIKADGLSTGQVDEIIKNLAWRDKMGYCTPPQQVMLQRLGVSAKDALKMKRGQAGAEIKRRLEQRQMKQAAEHNAQVASAFEV